jgi:hypothetical protein
MLKVKFLKFIWCRNFKYFGAEIKNLVQEYKILKKTRKERKMDKLN